MNLNEFEIIFWCLVKNQRKLPPPSPPKILGKILAPTRGKISRGCRAPPSLYISEPTLALSSPSPSPESRRRPLPLPLPLGRRHRSLLLGRVLASTKDDAPVGSATASPPPLGHRSATASPPPPGYGSATASLSHLGLRSATSPSPFGTRICYLLAIAPRTLICYIASRSGPALRQRLRMSRSRRREVPGTSNHGSS